MSGSTKRKLFEKEKDKGGERASEREREFSKIRDYPAKVRGFDKSFKSSPQSFLISAFTTRIFVTMTKHFFIWQTISKFDLWSVL